MQKTINSNIGGRIFHVEEDAYGALDSYLRDVKNHFSSYADRDEIMADIENRIAEQFESLGRGKELIISKVDVETVIATMGRPQDFSDEATDDKHEPTASGPHKRSRLYRNTDDQIIAGVASGIAAYFSIDPVWVRLLFGLSIFFGGFGILLYIVLWIIVPEAETAADKVEMHGSAVTLASIEKSIKDTIHDEKAKQGFKKAGEGVRKTGSALGRAIRFIAKTIIRIVGAVLTLGFFIAALATLFAAITLLANGNSPYVDFPLRDFLTRPELYTIIFSGFFSIFIPLTIMSLIGATMASFRNVFNKPLTIAAVVIWFVALFTVLSVTLHAAPRFEEFKKIIQRLKPRYERLMRKTLPKYRLVTTCAWKSNRERNSKLRCPRFSVIKIA